MVGYVEDVMIWKTEELANNNILLNGDVVKVWEETDIKKLQERINEKIFWATCQENLCRDDMLLQLKEDVDSVFEGELNLEEKVN